MPRKPKASVENKPIAETAASSADGKASADEPKKKARAVAASTKKKKPAAPKKLAAKQAPATAPAAFEPTDEQIRLRAYFLAERRHRLSLPGDSNHDWIEARRQLIEESQRPAS